jgi:hypothetical protein
MIFLWLFGELELNHDWAGWFALLFILDWVWRATYWEFKSLSSALLLASSCFFETGQLINDPDWNHNDPPGSRWRFKKMCLMSRLFSFEALPLRRRKN